ncbi:hypothetical protein [Rubrobacter taiwanensis]|nr:hypothetical protein [Rubrobacter taiwanensis]
MKERAGILAGAAAAAEGARPFAERLLYDDELQENIRTFLESARKIYEELSGDSPDRIAARLWDDDKLRRRVEEAVHAAQEGSLRLRGERVRKGGGKLRKLVFVLAVVVAFLMLNPKTGPEARQTARNIYHYVTSGE